MTTESPPTRLLSGEHRQLTISLMAAIALVSYNNLSVSAALPSIGDDLGSVSLLPWIITVELLAAAVAVLAIGPTVDSSGVQQVFRVSMVTFIFFSLLCAIAPSMSALIAFRLGQGVAAGGVIGSAVSSVGLSYSPEIRPKVYATISAVWGVMGLGGPAVAAGLISVFGWRSIFSAAVPVGIIATMVGWNHLPGRREGIVPKGFDRLGLVLVAVVTIGLLMAASAGSIWALVWMSGALAFGVFYVRHSRGLEDPVVKLEHLTGRRWRYLHITSTLAVAGGTGASAYLPLYLRGARGASETEAAFSVVFLVIGWTTGAFIASKLQEKMHAAYVVRRGSWLLITSMTSATLVTGLELHLAWLLATFFFVGSSIGSITTSGLSILQGRATADEMGRVSSAHQFVRSLGFAYGAAVGGAVLFFVVSRQINDVEAIRDLLGGDTDVPLNAEAVDALQLGYVWALGIAASLTTIAASAAIKLVRSIGMFGNSTV